MSETLYIYLLSYSTYLNHWLNFGSFHSSFLKLFLVFGADFMLYFNVVTLVFLYFFYKNKTLKVNFNVFIEQSLKFFIFYLWITLVLLVLSIWVLIGVFNTAQLDLWSNIYIFSTDFKFSIYTQSIKIILNLIGLAVCYIWLSTIRIEITVEVLILLSLLFSIGFNLISVNNFILFSLYLESFSIILYILSVTFYSYGSIIAAIKYFIFGSLGSIFLLWGIINLYRISPSLSYNSLLFINKFILNSLYELNLFNNLLNFSFSLITVGFLFKLGVVPAHGWVVDLYSSISYKILLVFMVYTKFIFFIMYLHVSLVLVADVIIDISIFFSLFFGCIMTIRQVEIKKFLAYGSIVHTAFLLMADLPSSILYLITYILANLVFLSVLVNIYNIRNYELIYLKDLFCLRHFKPFTVFLILVSLFSLAGLPPFAGFYGKFFVWLSLVEDIYLFNSLTAYLFLFSSLLLSLFIIFYYIRLVIYLFLSKEKSYLTMNQNSLKVFLDDEKFLNIGVTFLLYKKKAVFILQILISWILIFWSLYHSSIIKFILFICTI